jgi:hypothetical protein
MGFRSNYDYKKASGSGRAKALSSSNRFKRDMDKARRNNIDGVSFRARAVKVATSVDDRGKYTGGMGPDEPLAQYLGAIGERGADARDYNVGDTPGVK